MPVGPRPCAARYRDPRKTSFLGLALGEPLEVPVIGEARRPARGWNGEVRCVRIVETVDQRHDPGNHAIDQLTGVAGVDRTALAGGLAAAQPPVFERRR